MRRQNIFNYQLLLIILLFSNPSIISSSLNHFLVQHRQLGQKKNYSRCFNRMHGSLFEREKHPYENEENIQHIFLKCEFFWSNLVHHFKMVGDFILKWLEISRVL